MLEKRSCFPKQCCSGGVGQTGQSREAEEGDEHVSLATGPAAPLAGGSHAGWQRSPNTNYILSLKQVTIIVSFIKYVNNFRMAVSVLLIFEDHVIML